MATLTTRLGLRKAGTGDFVDVVNDLDDNWDEIDARCAVLDKTNTFTLKQTMDAGVAVTSLQLGPTAVGGILSLSNHNGSERLMVLHGFVGQASNLVEGYDGNDIVIYKLGPSGNISTLGQGNFGNGTFDADSGFVRVGNSADSALVLAQHGVNADADLVLRTKGDAGILRLQNGDSQDVVAIGSDGTNRKLAFFSSSLALKQAVAGSRGGNAALTALLTALETYGLITDNST